MLDPGMIQVLPGTPGGVLEYARALDRGMRSYYGTETKMLLCGDQSAGDDEWRIPRSTQHLLQALVRETNGNRCSVILHYSNYGYAPRGCPFWLIKAFEQWKERLPGPKFVIVFHEVYATGLPWQSSFWLSPVQRRLASRVLSLCDHAVTSLNRYKRILHGMNSTRPVDVLPVFSTVGEPSQILPYNERPPRMVVFGSAGRRELAYTKSGAALEQACRKLGIEELIDIGPPLSQSIQPPSGIKFVSTGYLEPESVSKWMSKSRYGFLYYPPAFLPKSTIFAAYCAHGLVPVISGPVEQQSYEDLIQGRHYWFPLDETAEPAISQIGDKARKLYEDHRLHSHIELLAAALGIRNHSAAIRA